MGRVIRPHAKASGSWKEGYPFLVKVAGSWLRASRTWVKKNGSWSGNPMLVFFTSAPGTGFTLCNGSGGLPNLDDHYPYGSLSQGQSTGSHTHDHGLYSGSSGWANTDGKTGTFTSTYYVNGHTHTINHTHPAINHEPPYYTVYPYAKDSSVAIPVGGLLFWTGTTLNIPAGWAAFSAAYDKYLKMMTGSAGGTGGNSTHTHSFTGNTGTKSRTTAKGSSWDAVCCVSHSHQFNHTHSAYNNDPRHIDLIPIQATQSITVVASGIVAFFLGSAIPPGWSVYTPGQNSLVRCKNTVNETQSGERTHSHGTDTFHTGNTSFSYKKKNSGASAADNVHGHSTSHGHPADTSLPKHFPLLLCKKD